MDICVTCGREYDRDYYGTEANKAFKPGDRVEVVEVHSGAPVRPGAVGTVQPDATSIAVEFDDMNYMQTGNDSRGPWYFYPDGHELKGVA